jgi:hypothetical protein
MTLLIKLAGDRKLVMFHLGREEQSAEGCTPRLNFESLRSFRGTGQKMQLLIDRVCTKLLTPGSLRVSPMRLKRPAAIFYDVRVKVRWLNATLR